jgi:hypothetical protein
MNPRVIVGFLVALFLAGTVTIAQPAATGSIEGRVFDAGRGEFLEKARVTVEGTAAETLTDSSGQFRLGNVPAGTVRVKVFFTGLGSRIESVAVTAGQTVAHDFTFENLVPGAPGVVKLGAFQVYS